MSEMLVRSQYGGATSTSATVDDSSLNNEIRGQTLLELLPAMPREWLSSGGYVRGLRTRGGIEIVEMKWSSPLGTLDSARLRFRVAIRCGVRWNAVPLRVTERRLISGDEHIGPAFVVVVACSSSDEVSFVGQPEVDYIVEPCHLQNLASEEEG